VSQVIADQSSGVQDTETIAYRDGFKNMLRIVFMMGIVIFGLMGVVFYYISSVLPQDRYWAVTIEGESMPMVDLGDPNVNNASLLAWASRAASDIMTFGFNDIGDRFAHSRTYFSQEGWDSFSEAMAKSGLLRNVTAVQQIVTSIPRDVPVLAGAMMRKGKYTWIVDVPLVMTIRAGSASASQIASVRMYIVKMPTTQNPTGVGIQTWQSY
jgi:intracellular multiplication protein IcmL